jgi:hypothetical protein
MSGYESDDSHASDPILLGITGDACATCFSTTTPLYDLSCHPSNDFYCRTCRTATWHAASD